jgi:hypothetical protein
MSETEMVTWGETHEDAMFVCETLDRIQALRPGADDYAADRAAYAAELRGCATMLGFAIPVGEDAPEALRAFLVASRDHEGETSERMIRAAYGKGAEEQKAARVAAQQYSGRRGWLDSAADAIARGLKALDEVRAWETRRKAA